MGELYEWYTELLTKRYFNAETPSYIFGVKIMQTIETILGKDYLEQAYFSGNFKIITKKLTSCIGYKTSFILFGLLDNIFKLELENDFLNKKEDIQTLLNNIYKTLFYHSKRMFKHNRCFNEDQINILRDTWCSNITFDYREEKLVFTTLDKKIFDDFISEIQYNKKINEESIKIK